MTDDNIGHHGMFVLDENGFLVDYDTWVRNNIKTGVEGLPSRSEGGSPEPVKQTPLNQPEVPVLPATQPRPVSKSVKPKVSLPPLPPGYISCAYCAARVHSHKLRSHIAAHELHCLVCHQKLAPGGLDTHLKVAHGLKTKAIRVLSINDKLLEIATYECLVCHGEVLFSDLHKHQQWCSPKDVATRAAILKQQNAKKIEPKKHKQVPEPTRQERCLQPRQTSQPEPQPYSDKQSRSIKKKTPSAETPQKKDDHYYQRKYCPYCGERTSSGYMDHIMEEHSETCFLCGPKYELEGQLDVHLHLSHHLKLLGCHPELLDETGKRGIPYFLCTRCNHQVSLPELKQHLSSCKKHRRI